MEPPFHYQSDLKQSLGYYGYIFPEVLETVSLWH